MEKHFTASAFVFDKNGKALVILHDKARIWLPSGGHLEEGENPANAAVREVFEETGYKIKIITDSFRTPEMVQVPVSISQHFVGKDHIHIDFNYAALLENEKKHESENLIEKWITPEEAIKLFDKDVHTLERYQRAYKKFKNIIV